MPFAMTRQEHQFGVAQGAFDEFVRRFSERSADVKFPDSLQAFYLVKTAAADHADNLFAHVVSIVSAVTGLALCLGDCFTLQLPAGSGDVVPPRTANVDLQAIGVKDPLEALDIVGFRSLKLTAGMR